MVVKQLSTHIRTVQYSKTLVHELPIWDCPKPNGIPPENLKQFYQVACPDIDGVFFVGLLFVNSRPDECDRFFQCCVFRHMQGCMQAPYAARGLNTTRIPQRSVLPPLKITITITTKANITHNGAFYFLSFLRYVL